MGPSTMNYAHSPIAITIATPAKTVVAVGVELVSVASRTASARPMRTIPSTALQGRFPLLARSGGRIVRAVGSAYAAALGNWAPASRPVRAVGGVYTGRRHDVVRKEGSAGW